MRWLLAFFLLLSFLLLRLSAAAQQQTQSEIELRARARLFPDAPAGVTALKSRRVGDGRHYYLLTARGTTILAYDGAGKRLAQFPPTPATTAEAGRTPSSATPQASSLQYGDDLDVQCAGVAAGEATCFLYVADRGANAIKVFSSEGQLVRSLAVPAPTSVAALAEGEVAAATMRSPQLVNVFNAEGKLVREFGELSEVAQTRDLNRFLNIGRLATDSKSQVYYSFSYLPEPTVRKYDRFGHAALEIQLVTLDFQPTAQARRRAIERQDASKSGRAPGLLPVVTAIAVDAETQEVWLGLGGLLMRFDAEGVRRGLYRLFTAEGARIEVAALLVEADRLLIASGTLGVFEFPRPDKTRR